MILLPVSQSKKSALNKAKWSKILHQSKPIYNKQTNESRRKDAPCHIFGPHRAGVPGPIVVSG